MPTGRTLDPALSRLPTDPDCGYVTPADVQTAIDNAIARTGGAVTLATLNFELSKLSAEIIDNGKLPRLRSLSLNQANEVVATWTDGTTQVVPVPVQPAAPYDDTALRDADALLDQRVTVNATGIAANAAAIAAGTGGVGAPPYDDTAVRADIAANASGLATETQARTVADDDLDTRVAALESAPGGGTGSPYDDTQIKADIAANTADVAAVAQASLQGDTGLDTRVTALEGAPAPTFDADAIAETATRVWVTPAQRALIGTGGGTGSPPYDDTQIKADLAQEVTDRTAADAALDAKIAAIPTPYDDTALAGRVTVNEQAIAAIPAPTAPYDDTALTASVTANTQAIAALPAPYDDTALVGRVAAIEAAPATPHWVGTRTDYDLIAAPDPATVYVITGP